MKAVAEFLEDRLRFYMETVLKFRYDTVRAILAAGWDVPRGSGAARQGAGIDARQ